MKLILALLQYLPLVLKAVEAAEEIRDITGEQKKQLVLGTMKHAVGALSPGLVSDDDWKLISQVVDSAVAMANASGVFKKKKA